MTALVIPSESEQNESLITILDSIEKELKLQSLHLEIISDAEIDISDMESSE